MSGFDDSMTLTEVRGVIRELAFDGGVRCPCCGRFSKVYRRSITGNMAKMMIRMKRATSPGEFVYLPSLRDGDGARDDAMPKYWGLIEEQDIFRDDGGHAGWWRLTGLGRRFVVGMARIHKYAIVYQNEVIQFEGDSVSIADCLGERFNYTELMNS